METEITSYRVENLVDIKQSVRDMLSQGWTLLTTYTVKEGISYVYFVWYKI